MPRYACAPAAHGVVEVGAVPSADLDGRQERVVPEPGGEDQRVDPASAPSAVTTASRVMRLDRLDDQLDVGAVERRIVVVRDQRPLASVRRRRRQLLPDRGIRNDGDCPPARLGRLPERLRVGEGDGAVHLREDLAAEPATASGSARNDSISSRLQGVSSLGSTQLAERWKTMSCAACLAISGMNWTALAAVPMTPTRRPIELVRRVPSRRMEQPSREGVDPFDLGPGQLVEHADAGDHDVEHEPLARRAAERPLRSLVVPARPGHLGVEANPLPQAVRVDDPVEVREDLVARAVRAAPIELGRERERVEVRPDVTRQTRDSGCAATSRRRRRPAPGRRRRRSRPRAA